MGQLIRTKGRGMMARKYPVGTAGHMEQLEQKHALQRLDVTTNRMINQAKRERLGLSADKPMYEVGQHVATLAGTSGRIIGSAQYVWGWEYRIRPDGKTRTIYREEWQIRGPNPGTIASGDSGFTSKDHGL